MRSSSLACRWGECKVFLTHTHFDHAESTRVLFPEGTCVYVSEVGFEERSPIRAEAARELFLQWRMLKMGATLADAEEYSRNDYEPIVFCRRARSTTDSCARATRCMWGASCSTSSRCRGIRSIWCVGWGVTARRRLR